MQIRILPIILQNYKKEIVTFYYIIYIFVPRLQLLLSTSPPKRTKRAKASTGSEPASRQKEKIRKSKTIQVNMINADKNKTVTTTNREPVPSLNKVSWKNASTLVPENTLPVTSTSRNSSCVQVIPGYRGSSTSGTRMNIVHSRVSDASPRPTFLQMSLEGTVQRGVSYYHQSTAGVVKRIPVSSGAQNHPESRGDGPDSMSSLPPCITENEDTDGTSRESRDLGARPVVELSATSTSGMGAYYILGLPSQPMSVQENELAQKIMNVAQSSQRVANTHCESLPNEQAKPSQTTTVRQSSVSIASSSSVCLSSSPIQKSFRTDGNGATTAVSNSFAQCVAAPPVIFTSINGMLVPLSTAPTIQVIVVNNYPTCSPSTVATTQAGAASSSSRPEGGSVRLCSIAPAPPSGAIAPDYCADVSTTTKPIHGMHTQRRTYQCQHPNCNKMYYKNSHLKVHQRIHTGM